MSKCNNGTDDARTTLRNPEGNVALISRYWTCALPRSIQYHLNPTASHQLIADRRPTSADRVNELNGLRRHRPRRQVPGP